MASETLKRVGRGGAGNYVNQHQQTQHQHQHQQQQQQQAPQQARAPAAVEDLELGLTVSNSSTSSASNGLERVTSKEDPVVRVGRGGAGNWMSSEDKRQRDEEHSVGATEAAPTSHGPPSYRGRGGAGNFTGFTNAAADAKAEREAQARREQVSQSAMRDVEAALPVPPSAHTRPRNGE